MDFPTPPLPDEIAMIRAEIGLLPAGPARRRVTAWTGSAGGGPWVTLAGPAGFLTADPDALVLHALDGRTAPGLPDERGGIVAARAGR